MNWLPLDLEPQYTLIVTHQQVKRHIYQYQDSSKADHEGQKMVSGPIPGNPHAFPKIAGKLLHALAYEITHTYKHWQPHTLVLILPSETAHTLSMECVYL